MCAWKNLDDNRDYGRIKARLNSSALKFLFVLSSELQISHGTLNHKKAIGIKCFKLFQKTLKRQEDSVHDLLDLNFDIGSNKSQGVVKAKNYSTSIF